MKFVFYSQIHWLLVVKLSCHFTLLLSCKIQSLRAAKNTACIFISPLQHKSHVIWQGFMLIFDRLQPPTWETITEQKRKFSIKDFFSKCEEILNRKLHFLCSACTTFGEESMRHSSPDRRYFHHIPHWPSLAVSGSWRNAWNSHAGYL